LPTQYSSHSDPREFPVGSPKLLCLSLTSRPLPRLSHLTILELFHMSVSVPCRKFSHNARIARLLPLAVCFELFISHRLTFFTIPGLQPNLELRTTNVQPAKFQSAQTVFILVSKVMFSLHPSLSYPLFVFSSSPLHESLHFICVLADFTAML